MAKPLIILESPNKVKTVQKFLGNEYKIIASGGHIKDLPKKSLGIDIEHGFKPHYVTIPGKKSTVDTIKKEGAEAETVYLATDPDREGEAIAWHLAEIIRSANPNQRIYRIEAKEINARAFREQLDHPGQLNENMYDSQQTRRLLDRLVGYQISPILWDKVKMGLSAGRVQSAAVRIIVDREKEIRAHVPIEYWEILAKLRTAKNVELTAELAADGDKTIYMDSASVEKNNPKGVIANEEAASEIVARSKNAPFVVGDIKKTSKSTKPDAPFATSDMCAKASSQLHFTSKKTMSLAQKLFEGIELGAEGPTGLITYMRTDSVRVSDEAIADCRNYIGQAFGQDYLPDSPVHYEPGGKKGKKSAAPIQDAHEAIRPTNVMRTPESIRQFLTPDLYKLYALIWKRFVASQMKPAVYDTTTIYIKNGDLTYRISGSTPRFDGFRKITGVSGESAVVLPELKTGDNLDCLDVTKLQKMTPPPRRYSEADFIQHLRDTGIGRPSTYAATVSGIQERGYVENTQRGLAPTELGEIVTQLLVENFNDIVDVKFTAGMESQLDQIAEGQLGWIQALTNFYKPFNEELELAKKSMRNVKRESEKTDIKCSKCGAFMVIKWGKNGHFLACDNYPECKNTCDFKQKEDGSIEIVEKTVEKRGKCPDCGRDMIVRSGKFGKFLACSGYPECKHTENITLDIACPREGCTGKLVQKRTKRGKVFYGCNRYPECDYSTWNQPTAERCPNCAEHNLEIVRRGQNASYLCPGCAYSRPLEIDEK